MGATNKLTDRACKAAVARERPYKLADGGGLYLHVAVSGARLWRLAYRFGGRQKTAAFGGYPDVSLADARGLRERARGLLAAGIDPTREAMRRAALIDVAGGATSPPFEAMARRWVATRERGWTARYSATVTARLERWILPAIGHVPIGDLGPPVVLAALRAAEAGGAVTVARRMKAVVSAVFRFAVAEGVVARDVTADLSAALAPVARVRHNPKLAADAIGPFLRRLDRYDGEAQTALAIRLVLHTMVRTRELRLADRDGEFDLAADPPVWRIPAERMKKARPHLVPLSRQAIGLYERLRRMAPPGGYLAPGLRGGPMSENTMLFALYRMGYKGQLTVHGLRGTASTVLHESGLWQSDWIERQLAHDDDDKIRAAYNAAQYIRQRHDMLCWWSDYLDRAEGSAI